MKGILKKLMQIGFAGALSLLAFAPSAVRAAGESVSVTIPVSTEFTQDSDEPLPLYSSRLIFCWSLWMEHLLLQLDWFPLKALESPVLDR